MCSEFRDVRGFHQNQKCDKSNESYRANLFDVMLFVMQYQMVISLASPPPPQKKNKQTNKQNKQAERKSTGAPQQLWPITAARIIIKKNSDTRKTTVTYNKLFDETRD